MGLADLLRKTVLAAGLAASVTFNSGCAFGNRHVDLTYSSYAADSAKETVQHGEFSLGKFENQLETDKKGRQIIGCVRNGYGWKTAKVLAKNDAAEWLRGAIGKELESNGYREVEGGTPVIEGKLNRLYTDIHTNYNAEITFSINIENDNRTVFTDSFYGNATPHAWFATAKEYGKASEEALQSALRKAIPKISLEIDKHSRE